MGMRIYDAEQIARDMTKRFKDRDVERTEHIKLWPGVMQHVGDSLAVAYSSDKWQKDRRNRRWELYKHLAESRNHAFVVPGLLVDYHSRGKSWPVMGPHIDVRGWPLPEHYSSLALFEELNLHLFTEGDDDDPRLSDDPDEGVVKVTIRHGMVGGSMLRWSEVDGGKDEPFLFIYTRSEGPLVIIRGEELDVLKDGIVG